MKRIIKKLFSRKAVISYIVIAVLVAGGFFFFGRTVVKSYETATVARGDVLETVTATGQIKPKVAASLRFKISGTINQLLASVGDSVKSGQLLARLDDSDLLKKLSQAQAELNTARVGFENSTQNVVDTKSTNDESLNLLYADAPNTFSTIFNLTQQAYSTYATFYDSTNNRLLSAIDRAVTNSQLVLNANYLKSDAEFAITEISAILRDFSVSSDRVTIDATINRIHNPMQKFQTALVSLIDAINGIPVGASAISDSTLAGYKSTLATARTNLNSAITYEVDLGKNIRNTKVSNGVNLNTAQAAEREAEANLEKAKASLSIAERNVSDVYLKSPIDGTIAVKDSEIGELVTTAEQVYYVIGGSDLEIISNVPEVDVARIRVGGEVDATLDALSPDEHFKVAIVSIDPDQTTIDGVVHYKTHFKFEKNDPRFKSGMSVNLTIVVNKRTSVLMVPRRAVTEKNGVAQVRVLQGQLVTTKTVSIGLKGDSYYQITSGLTDGDKVIVAEKTTK